MIRYILRATASRKAEASVVAFLAALIAGVVAAAPWYATDRAVKAAVAGLQQTPAAKAVVSGQRIVPRNESLASAQRGAASDLRSALDLGHSRIVTGVQADGLATTPDRPAGVARLNSQLVQRSGACAEVVVRGRCPQAATEAMITSELAAELSLDLGGTVIFSDSSPQAGARLTVTGIYRMRDPQARYWAGHYPDRAQRDRIIMLSDLPSDSAAFTASAGTPRLVVDLIPDDDIFRYLTPAEVLDRIDRAPLSLSTLEYTTTLRDLAADLDRHRSALWQGMLVIAGEIIAFSWLVLFLVLRQMSWQHRTDLGTLKLRGVGTLRAISLTVGRHFGGLVLGGIAGTAAATGFALSQWDYDRAAAVLSVAGVALVFAGSCLAGLIAERWSLRTDVLNLLRSVPRGHGGIVLLGLRVGVVAAAAATVILARDAPGIVGDAAPAVLALAIGVIVAETCLVLLGLMATHRLRRAMTSTTRSLRAGMLAAYWHSRRPALLRANAILTVTVAMAAMATGAFLSTERAQRERAERTLGADRVLTVLSGTNAQLLSAVRAADPSGTKAMAAVRHPDAAFLTVDTARLAAVARWPHTGTPIAELARSLRPRNSTDLPGVQGNELSVAAHRNDSRTGPVFLRFGLVDAEGREAFAAAGPVTRAGGTLRVALAGCPCRVREIALRTDGGQFAPTAPSGTDVTITASNVDAPLTDRARWRSPQAIPPTMPLTIATTPEGLRLTMPETFGLQRVAAQVLPDPGIDRLPVIVGGGYAIKSAAPEANVFPAVNVPIEPVGRTDVIPGGEDVGTGDGLLADLELADRFGAGVVGPEIQEVWLAPGADDEVVETLRQKGLLVLDDRDAAGEAQRWASQVEPGLTRYRVIGWWLVVLTSVVALLVLLVGESAELSTMLRALREQGLPRRVARWAAAGVFGAPVVASIVAALLTALLARPPLLSDPPLFDDAFRPLADGTAMRLLTSLAALVVAAILLAVAGLVANRRLRLKS